MTLQTFRGDVDGLKIKLDQLTAIGHQLMRSSSAIRASDIENRLGSLSELWYRLDEKAKTRSVRATFPVLYCVAERCLQIREHNVEGIFPMCMLYGTPSLLRLNYRDYVWLASMNFPMFLQHSTKKAT